MKEVDSFKNIERHIYYPNGKRENDAEHSWALTLFLLLFQKEYSHLDLYRMLKMTVIHDLVEIYAGDACAFDEEARKGKEERERIAAKKLFSQLPEDLEKEFSDLLDEYEKRETPESKVVSSLDKIQPIICNLCTEGKTWQVLGVDYNKLDQTKRKHMLHDDLILKIYESTIKEALDKGYLKK